jgi:hypothetical protein
MAEYSKTLLVYLDIMGFKELIDQSRVDTIIETISILKQQAASGLWLSSPWVMGAPKAQMRNFSDLIVRARPITTDDNVLMWVNTELMTLSDIQLQLYLTHGIMVRGGMCWGDLFIQDDVIFGPALVKGHRLEEDLAVYPRIAIDPSIMDLQPTEKFKNFYLFKDYIARGDDGVYFVNYLHHLHNTFENPYDTATKREYDIDALELHAEFINTKLKEFSTKPERVKQKAIWLGLYHNSFLNTAMQENPSLKERLTAMFISDDQLKWPSNRTLRNHPHPIRKRD